LEQHRQSHPCGGYGQRLERKPEFVRTAVRFRGCGRGSVAYPSDGIFAGRPPASSRDVSGDQLPLCEFEGAFLPATFWLAHALAKAGYLDEAEAILNRCEAFAGELGLFAEEVDPRRQIFLGNTPLLFAHVEYFRAARDVATARVRQKPEVRKKYEYN
jgi:GH15 family glucan-1,4-alpha-glucosidase